VRLSEHTGALDALAALLGAVAPGDDVLSQRVEPVEADELPAPYGHLLRHRGHMTTRLERYYGAAVRLHVLASRARGDSYARHITLTVGDDEAVVEVGLVRINLAVAAPQVRAEIEAAAAPLGEILIRHDVLRTIEPHWYLRFAPGAPLAAPFGAAATSPTFGRLGTIYCDDAPAIELLEIVADRRSDFPTDSSQTD